MAIKRRIALKSNKRSSLTYNEKTQLLDGLNIDGFNDTPTMKLAWDKHRVELLTKWIKLRPFTRPFAWWEFEKPRNELRRQVSGPSPLIDSPIYMGAPCHWPAGELTFESEFSFLRRLNLLTRPELSLLKGKSAEEIARLETPGKPHGPENVGEMLDKEKGN